MRSPSKRRRDARWLLYTLASLACLLRPSMVPAQIPEEAVKAEFLYRFAGYVDWPPPAMRDGRFEIAVIGSEGVALALRRILDTHRVQNLPASVRVVHRVEEIGAPRMLYLATDRTDLVRTAAAAARHRPILLVTDTLHGLDLGSAVNFVSDDRRVRFEVSLPAVQAAGLTVSAELLAVALRVRGIPGHGSRGPATARESGP